MSLTMQTHTSLSLSLPLSLSLSLSLGFFSLSVSLSLSQISTLLSCKPTKSAADATQHGMQMLGFIYDHCVAMSSGHIFLPTSKQHGHATYKHVMIIVWLCLHLARQVPYNWDTLSAQLETHRNAQKYLHTHTKNTKVRRGSTMANLPPCRS